jgi:uracil-DNA glycosylase
MAANQGQQPDFFTESGRMEPPGDRLTDWQPQQWPLAADWQPLIAGFLDSEPAKRLGHFISQRLQAGAIIFPPQPFQALALTPLAAVRVVIVGQDPYHGPGQAHGLAFSVAKGLKLPPSLRNIFKELARAAAAREPGAAQAALPVDGSLLRWAQQGVLLLNTCLTVESGAPASHSGKGWEVLTDEIIKAVLSNGKPVVFMLWGAHAQKLLPLLRSQGQVFDADTGRGRHRVLTANHPSPLSALRAPQPFIGCGHFEQANLFLKRKGEAPVAW